MSSKDLMASLRAAAFERFHCLNEKDYSCGAILIFVRSLTAPGNVQCPIIQAVIWGPGPQPNLALRFTGPARSRRSKQSTENYRHRCCPQPSPRIDQYGQYHISRDTC